MIPGEMTVAAGELELNAGRKAVTVKVTNTGDRPIQVGSHYHFYETNAALDFDRERGVREPHAVAGGRAEHFRIGLPGDFRHGRFAESDPITAALKP